MKPPLRQALISVHGADVRFGATHALRGATLTVHRGDRLVLVGANGSGKTTLIRLMHGLVAPAKAGSVQTHALAPEGRAPRAAMVFQKPFLLSLSVRWNVLLAGFGRAIAEVGAVMIVGGNIDGVTRVMTTTIALETSKGDLPLALALGLVLIAIVLIVNAVAQYLREWARVRYG